MIVNNQKLLRCPSSNVIWLQGCIKNKSFFEENILAALKQFLKTIWSVRKNSVKLKLYKLAEEFKLLVAALFHHSSQTHIHVEKY